MEGWRGDGVCEGSGGVDEWGVCGWDGGVEGGRVVHRGGGVGVWSVGGWGMGGLGMMWCAGGEGWRSGVWRRCWGVEGCGRVDRVVLHIEGVGVSDDDVRDGGVERSEIQGAGAWCRRRGGVQRGGSGTGGDLREPSACVLDVSRTSLQQAVRRARPPRARYQHRGTLTAMLTSNVTSR